MSKLTCLGCSRVNECTELIHLIEKDPSKLLTHYCDSFSGISTSELQIRKRSIDTFGVALAAASITQIEKEVHVAYSKEELEELPRALLRTKAQELGLSPSESSDRTVDELREYILKNQKGAKKGTKKGTKKGAAKAADPEPEGAEGDEGESDERQSRSRVNYEDEEEDTAKLEAVEEDDNAGDENEDEDEESPSELKAQIAKLQKTVTALGDMIGDRMDTEKKFRQFSVKAFAVLDRKVNCIIGGTDIIGRKVVGGKFDPMKCEESFSEKFKHTTPLNTIERIAGVPREAEEEG